MNNHLNNRVRSERGQVMVLMVMALTALLAFTALAIDGGMIYSDRRFGQSAADTATLAGGSQAAMDLENAYITTSNWDCSSSEIQNAVDEAVSVAIDRAAQNGFEIDDMLDPEAGDNSGVQVTCMDAFGGFGPTPLVVVPPGPTERYIEVHVMLTFETRTSFLHMFYNGHVMQTVDAVTRVMPRSTLAMGYAIVTLNPSACSGMGTGFQTHGTADLYIYGGGIFSNGCIRGSGGPLVNVYNAEVSYVEELFHDDCDNFFIDDANTCPGQVSEGIPPETYDIPEPDCTGHEVSPSAIAGKTLAPGLYCVSGDLKLNGGSTIGDGVTIVMLDGKLTINGNADVNLKAPVDDTNGGIPGVLFYAPPSNTSTFKINGSSDSFFQGTILAAGANVELEGTGNTDAYHVQVIAWNVEAGGTSDLYLIYDANEQYTLPTNVNLWH